VSKEGVSELHHTQICRNAPKYSRTLSKTKKRVDVHNLEEIKITEIGTYTEATGMASMNLSTIS
jgi:hypothetical protein